MITPAVAQHPMTTTEIDADPLAVLPSGFIGIMRAEVPAVAKSSLGPTLLALANKLAPLPASSGFVAERISTGSSLAYIPCRGQMQPGLRQGV